MFHDLKHLISHNLLLSYSVVKRTDKSDRKEMNDANFSFYDYYSITP